MDYPDVVPVGPLRFPLIDKLEFGAIVLGKRKAMPAPATVESLKNSRLVIPAARMAEQTGGDRVLAHRASSSIMAFQKF